MELQKEHTDLIQKLVKANPKYSGNEDLLEDFCSETYQKSYLILNAVEDMNSLEAYMKRVVSSAIIDVLKNNGRVIRTSKGYKPVQEVPLQQVAVKEETVEVMPVEHAPKTEDNIEHALIDEIEITPEPTTQKESSYVSTPPVLSDDILYVSDPRDNIEEQIIRKDILENIINLVKQIDNDKPQEKYLTIFYSRYFLHSKQKDIAEKVGISQAEVSKRLVKLSCLIKEKLY